jgi:hypothetical protein
MIANWLLPDFCVISVPHLLGSLSSATHDKTDGGSRGEALAREVEEGIGMISQYKRYKAHVAPIYQSEIDRHLFATASFRGRGKGTSRSATWRERLRLQWVGLWSRWVGRLTSS